MWQQRGDYNWGNAYGKGLSSMLILLLIDIVKATGFIPKLGTFFKNKQIHSVAFATQESTFLPWNLFPFQSAGLDAASECAPAFLTALSLIWTWTNRAFMMVKLSIKSIYQSITFGNSKAHVPTLRSVFLLKKTLGYWLCQVERHMLLVAVTFQRGYLLAVSLNPVIYVYLVSQW